MRDAGILECTRPRNLFMTAITVSKEEGRKLFISAVQQQSMKGAPTLRTASSWRGEAHLRATAEQELAGKASSRPKKEYRAGYDPSAFRSFFEKIQAMERKKPGTISKAFETHPPTPDRIEKAQEEIRKILPAKQEYIVTTSEFEDVKARLAAIENKHKVLDQKDASKPSLRRTANTGDNNGNTQSDNDRPTLKRRDDSN